MARLVVLADPDTSLGFQLAGVEVICADDFEEAREQLLALLADPSVGLIAASGALLDRLDSATRRLAEISARPVVARLPRGGGEAGLPTRREYLAGMIRRAIGFQITFPGEGDS